MLGTFMCSSTKGDILQLIAREFIEQLKEKGIGTSVHFIPVPMQPYYKRLGYNIEDYPNALKAFNGAISLPLYPKMTPDQVDYVIENRH